MSQEEKSPQLSEIRSDENLKSSSENFDKSPNITDSQKKKREDTDSKEIVEIYFSDDPDAKIDSDADEEREVPKDKFRSKADSKNRSTARTLPKSRSPSVTTPESEEARSRSKESRKKSFSILRFFRRKEKSNDLRNSLVRKDTSQSSTKEFSSSGKNNSLNLLPSANPTPTTSTAATSPSTQTPTKTQTTSGPSSNPKPAGSQNLRKSIVPGGSASSSTSIKIFSASELPRDVRQILKSLDVSQEEMERCLPVILNILTFTTHKYWKTNVPNPFDQDYKYQIQYIPETDIKSETHFADLKIPEGSKDPYKILQKAGKGGFGTVFQAKYKEGSDQKLAVKKLGNVRDRDRARNCREVGILSWTNHPNIVKYVDAFIIKDELWLIMEFLEGVSLNSLVSGFSFGEKQIALIINEILKGLDYLHNNNLIHRDIKSSNIMVCLDGVVKLIDFGLCNHVGVGARKKIVGSPYWIAPEMLRKQVYGFPVDIWSLGVVQIEMANRRPPSREPKLKALFKSGLKGIPVFPLEDTNRWSPEFIDFLDGCLKPDPTERSSSSVLIKHPFLEKATRSESLERYVQTIFMLDLKL